MVWQRVEGNSGSDFRTFGRLVAKKLRPKQLSGVSMNQRIEAGEDLIDSYSEYLNSLMAGMQPGEFQFPQTRKPLRSINGSRIWVGGGGKSDSAENPGQEIDAQDEGPDGEFSGNLSGGTKRSGDEISDVDGEGNSRPSNKAKTTFSIASEAT